jgi:hypothetical protein
MKKGLRVRWSCEHMQKGGRRLRFLTLTVPEHGLPLRVVTSRWRAFRSTRYMRDLLKGHSYICVYEKHPNGHGWHIHCVLNRFVNISRFREMASRYGFGRLHIELCGSDIGKYISKYISKSFEARPSDCKGVRLVNVSRCLLSLRDIAVSSPSIDFIRRNIYNPAVLHLKMFQRILMLQKSWAYRLLPQEMTFSLGYLGADSGLEFF